jgi:hypothetical protein
MKKLENWPSAGDKLVHKFRNKTGVVVAEVVSVDNKKAQISLRIDNRIFKSLSAAASFMSGSSSNGWIYWGLKKQSRKK